MNHNELNSEKPLPPGFVSIEQIRATPPDRIASTSLVNVIGILKDHQAPMITRGTDAKYTLEIVDHSTQGYGYGLKVNIFWPMDKMPKTVRRADIVLIRKIKIQTYNGNISLIANYGTEFHLLASKDMPTDPAKLKYVVWSSYPRTQKGIPNLAETRYGAWLHSNLAELDLPSDTEFEERTRVSMNVRDKFTLLKDVKCEQSQALFVNIIGEAIKIHDSSFDWLTLYISDYTAHSKFYNYVWGSGGADQEAAHDEWGYLQLKRSTTKKNEWPGPYGKMTLQVTVYDSQASYIRENIKVKQWMLLSNVQIKYGRQGNCLEGYLRGNERICTRKLEPSQDVSTDPESTEGRLQEAVKRKYLWTKKFKQQQKAIQDEECDASTKRKRIDENLGPEAKSTNSRQRRKMDREAVERKVKEAETRKMKLQHLNQNIKCSFPDEEPVSIKDILLSTRLDVEGRTLKAPFTNTKYRANVRVVDYFPHRIEDFAVGFRSSEFDMLSDYSGEEDSDVEVRREIWHSGGGFSKDQWEWRFALQVEDVDCPSTSPQDRLWLMVDNQAAQMLLNLADDATSLRSNQQLLTQVKEQLFKLWGNLEERKSALLPKVVPPAPTKTQSTQSFFSSPAPPSSPPQHAYPSFNGDSDDENVDSTDSRRIPCAQKSQDSALEEMSVNILSKNGDSNGRAGEPNQLSNKGFTCCVKQYGVKVEEPDPTRANAGNGMRWQRMFGLFGTMID